nr:uncharacterized protein LOC128691733 [Cherax quadricarinatus]
MVDSVSAETRIKELLEESRNCTYPEDARGIKQRYKDTALLLFKQSQEDNNPRNYLSFGTRRSSAVSQYGNTPIIVRRSRSSNGELSTVGEQVPSILGRSSVSDYTLIESKESDEEDTETEDELDNKNLLNSAEVALREKESSISKNKTSINDNETESQADLTQIKKNEKIINGLRVQECENRKSFSHYDLPIQRNKGHEEVDTKNCENERNQVKSERKTGEIDPESKCENGSLVVKSRETEGIPEEEVSPKFEHDSQHDTLYNESKGNINGSQSKVYPKDNNSKAYESHDLNDIVKPHCPEIDHEAVLRAYVEQSSSLNKLLHESQAKSCYSDSYKDKLYDECKYVELKIVESVDDPHSNDSDKGPSSDIKNVLTTDILKFGDDDDVTFIDANSPLLTRAKPMCEISENSNQELAQKQDDAKQFSVLNTPSKHEDKNLIKSSPPLIENCSLNESPQFLKGDSVEDVSKYLENHSGLLDLPLRSPTPPKRSPRRPPRVPKEKNTNIQCHSSLVLPSDEEIQESYPKGTRSASPTSKHKETSKFFSFSFRGEKSKSISSLNSKAGKDKVTGSALRFEGKDHTVINSGVNTDSKVDGQIDTFGKRIGVRSMVIDGTIKRNFIVIHPSDDSETIGLAPLSSVSSGKENSLNTSVALSSMKSHLTHLKNDNLEAVKRISCKGDLKEELTDLSRNFGGSLRIGHMSKSLNANKGKKTKDHKLLGSSQSLSSENTRYSFADSQALYRSLVLPEVDVGSVHKSSEGLNNSSRTVSKLCVVM